MWARLSSWCWSLSLGSVLLLTYKGCTIRSFVCLSILLTCRRHKSSGNMFFCSMSLSGKDVPLVTKSVWLWFCSRAGGRAWRAGSEEAETCETFLWSRGCTSYSKNYPSTSETERDMAYFHKLGCSGPDSSKSCSCLLPYLS